MSTQAAIGDGPTEPFPYLPETESELRNWFSPRDFYYSLSSMDATNTNRALNTRVVAQQLSSSFETPPAYTGSFSCLIPDIEDIETAAPILDIFSAEYLAASESPLLDDTYLEASSIWPQLEKAEVVITIENNPKMSLHEDMTMTPRKEDESCHSSSAPLLKMRKLERRREQNRKSQQDFRARKFREVQTLRDEIMSLRSKIAELEKENLEYRFIVSIDKELAKISQFDLTLNDYD